MLKHPGRAGEKLKKSGFARSSSRPISALDSNSHMDFDDCDDPIKVSASVLVEPNLRRSLNHISGIVAGAKWCCLRTTPLAIGARRKKWLVY